MDSATATGQPPPHLGVEPAQPDGAPPEFPRKKVTGRQASLTTFTATPWWSALRLRMVTYPVFHLFRWMHGVELLKPFSRLGDLKELAFISFAQWGVFGRARPGGGEKLKRRYILFEANFNGDFEQYIQGFSYILASGIRAMWKGAYGVPDPKPLWTFLRCIHQHEVHVNHYYAAYPEGSVKTIRAAAELKKRFDCFQQASADLEPDEFSLAYDRFMADVQKLI
jgi:hypothetical protein